MTEYEFTEGRLWGDEPWTIITDYTVNIAYTTPCEHCRSERDVHHVAANGNTYTNRVCTVPRIIVATNESGYSSVGICLDCILEAAQTLPEPEACHD